MDTLLRAGSGSVIVKKSWCCVDLFRLPIGRVAFGIRSGNVLSTVCVDDFKMAGPREHVDSGWSVLKQLLKLGDVEPAGLYLGCLHKVKSVLLKSGQMARRVEYDMSDFLRSCVEKYTPKTGITVFKGFHSVPYGTGLGTKL